MGFLSNLLFGSPRQQPKFIPNVIIFNRLGEEIDRVQGWDLCNKDLRNKDWRHVNLSGLVLDGSDLTGTNMIGANLRRASLRYCALVNCEISYADTTGCDFSGSNMVGCLLYRSETNGAKLRDVLISEESDIPKIKVFQAIRVSM